MRVRVSYNAVPHHVQMLSSEIDSELHPQIIQIHTNGRIVEPLNHWTLRNEKLSITKCDNVNILCFKCDLVIDMDQIHFRIKPDLGGVQSLIVCVLNHNPQRPNPSDFFTT